VSSFRFVSFFIFSYIGFNGGTPQLQEQKNIVFEQKGVYAASDENQPIIFTKEPSQTGFILDELSISDSIKIKPVWGISGEIKYWLIDASVKSYPLRINNKAINISNLHYFVQKDTIDFISKMDSINLRIIIDEYNDKIDLFYLQHFIKDTNEICTIISSDTICFPKIKDGIKVDRLFREINRQSSLNENKNESKTWFSNLNNSISQFFRKPEKKFKNRIYNINDYAIDSNIEDEVLFIRKYKTSETPEMENPLCLLNVENNNSYTTIKNSENSKVNFDTVQHNRYIDTLAVSDKLAFGYGLNTRFFAFSKNSKRIYENKYIAPIYFKYPKKINLPDSISDKSFLITSWKEFINFDNIFQVDVAGNQLPFFAKAEFSDEFSKVSINTGDNITDYSINENFYIDNGLEGVILSFSKNIQKPFFNLNVSYLIIAILLFTLIVFLIAWWKGIDSSAECDAKLLWSIIVFVLFFMAIIKLIISYRVASFPPQSANYKEIDLFSKTLHISIFSLFAIPSLIFFIRVKMNGLFNKLGNFIKNLFNSRINTWVKPFIIWLIFIVFLFIGAFTESNQSAFGLIRLNLLSILVTL